MKNIKKVFLTAVFGMGMAMLLTGCGSKNINLNKYTTVTVDGYDGLGRVVVDIDYDKMKEDYPNAKLKGDYEDWYDSAISLAEDMVINYKIEDNGQLSNGDKVTVIWNCADEQFKQVSGLTLQHKDIPVEIEGLSEIPTFDPFENVTVNFYGWDGVGTAKLELGDVVYGSGNDFEIKQERGALHNGDTITVSYNITDQNRLINAVGMVAECTEKTYTVEGLPTLVTEFSQLQQADIDSLISQATVAFEELRPSWFRDEGYSNIQYQKSFLLSEDNTSAMVVVFVGDYPGGLYTEIISMALDNPVIKEDGTVMAYGDYVPNMGILEPDPEEKFGKWELRSARYPNWTVDSLQELFERDFDKVVVYE